MLEASSTYRIPASPNLTPRSGPRPNGAKTGQAQAETAPRGETCPVETPTDLATGETNRASVSGREQTEPIRY